MRDILLKIFEKVYVDVGSFWEIAFLNHWHIIYFLLIIGGCITAGLFMKKASYEKQTKIFGILAILLCGLYVFDFFAIPLYYSKELANGELYYTFDIDKLPFHICTVLCPVVAFVQFNKKCARFREPVAILAIAAPLMYLVYPGSAIGELHTLCYKVVQTFIYHGVLLAWGYLNLATGYVKPVFKRCYKVAIGLGLIACWAMIGNITYSANIYDYDADPHYDWFFLTGSTFDFVPKFLMPFAVIAAVFCVALIIYGIYYLVLHIQNKDTNKPAAEETAVKEEEATV